jgi:NADH-quinone oxidoreductase subunit N
MSQALLFLPEAAVVLAGLLLLSQGRLPDRAQVWVPLLSPALVLVGLGSELWLGATPGTLWGGAYLQDRLALFSKAAVLLSLLVLLLAASWNADRSQSVLPLACLAALAGMLVSSAAWLPLLWIGLVVAALAGMGRGRPTRAQLGAVLGAAGLAGTGFLLLGLQLHSPLLTGPGRFSPGIGTALAAVVALAGTLAPLLLLPAGVWVEEEEAPAQEALRAGLVTVAAVVAAAKVLAVLYGAGTGWAIFLAVLAAFAVAGAGLAAFVAGSVRSLIAWLVTSQAAWMLGGLAANSRLGLGSAFFALGALAPAAAAAPLLVAGLQGPSAGLGRRQPWRWLSLSVLLLSLAGVPPLAGFFAQFSVAQPLIASRLTWVLAAGLLGTALSTWAVLRLLIRIWLEPEADSRPLPAQGWKLTAAFPALLVVAYGAFAYPVYSLAIQGAEALGLIP